MDKFKQYIYKTKIQYITIITVCLICYLVVQKLPQDLKISFIDVGQGDCTLITTPTHKNILIDGGGNTDNSYNVGESVLLPYLLNHYIKKIDVIVISHFDTDHVRLYPIFVTRDKSEKCYYRETI